MRFSSSFAAAARVIATFIVYFAFAGGCRSYDSSSPVEPYCCHVTVLSQVQVPYTQYDLTALFGGAIAVNNRTQVLSGDGTRVLRWDAGTTTTIDGCVHAYSMNDAGDVLCRTTGGFAVWQNGHLTAVPVLDSLNPATLVLNSAGEIAGLTYGAPICSDTCVFEIQAAKVEVLLQRPYISLTRFTNAGDVLIDGWMVRDYDYYNLLANPGRGTADTIDVALGGFNDINAQGTLVGEDKVHNTSDRPIVVADGVQTILGPSWAVGTALSINDSSSIVGMFSTGDPPDDPGLRGPFLVTPRDGVRSLTRASRDTAWVVTSVQRINNAGAILATGDDSTAHLFHHQLLLVPGQL